MKQFDVCWATGPRDGGRRRLVVVLQHHDFEAIVGVVVAPMYLATELPAFEQLRPQLKFKRQAYIVAVDRLGTLPKRQVGPAVGNLETLRYELTKAIDLIFSGF